MSFNFNVQGITTVDNTQTGSSTVIDTISPQNIKGLCYWIDGEINTRKGQDRSYKGMQNLVGGDYISKVPSGMQESMNGTPVFGDKWCTLGGTGFMPNFASTEQTIELCVEFNAKPYTFSNIIYVLHVPGDMEIWFGDNQDTIVRRLTFHLFESGAVSLDVNKEMAANYNQRLYAAVRFKTGNPPEAELFINGISTGVPVTGKNTTLSSSGYNCGICGLGNTSTSSVVPTESNKTPNGAFYGSTTKLYTLRRWTRCLSNEEILQNYKLDYSRFI